MNLEMSKVVNNVDMGVFGKKSISVELKLSPGKSGWELHCWYAYIVHGDGKKSPIQGNVISNEFLRNVVDECLAEVKAITEWKFPR